MSITTKRGDCGKTSLLGLQSVYKDDPQIEACGVLDELCSFLGLCRSIIKDKKTKETIEKIQRDLFVIGAEIVADDVNLRKIKERMDNSYIKRLEKNIKLCESSNKFKRDCFCVPGENMLSGFLDVSRAIARRLERQVVTLGRKKLMCNPCILIYLNRLSDLLYLFARLYEKKPLRLNRKK